MPPEIIILLEKYAKICSNGKQCDQAASPQLAWPELTKPQLPTNLRAGTNLTFIDPFRSKRAQLVVHETTITYIDDRNTVHLYLANPLTGGFEAARGSKAPGLDRLFDLERGKMIIDNWPGIADLPEEERRAYVALLSASEHTAELQHVIQTLHSALAPPEFRQVLCGLREDLLFSRQEKNPVLHKFVVDRLGAHCWRKLASRQDLEKITQIEDCINEIPERKRRDQARLGLEALLTKDLLSRSMRPIRGPVLHRRDGNSKAIVDHLCEMTTMGLSEEIEAAGVTERDIVGAVLMHIGEPASIVQGTRKTCAHSCKQFKLALQHPQEYVRIAHELVSPRLTASLVHKNRLCLQPHNIFSDDNTKRDDFSRFFQSSLADFCNGAQRSYDNRVDKHLYQNAQGEMKARDVGMLYGEMRVASFALYGEATKVYSKMPQEQLMTLLREEIFENDPRFLEKAKLPFAALRWSEQNHLIVPLYIKDERVYFYNSQRDRWTAGDILENPTRRVEGRGIESMDEADFAARFIALERSYPDTVGGKLTTTFYSVFPPCYNDYPNYERDPL